MSVQNDTRHRRKLRFSLSTLFLIMTMLSILLGVGHWVGWEKLYLADMAGMLAVTALPLVIVVVGRSHKHKEYIDEIILIAGVLLVVHLAATALVIELLLRQPWTLDLNPFDGVLCFTLNWSVPSAGAGLLIGLFLKKRCLCSWAFWIGGSLIICGSLAFIWYGHYFFGKLMEDSSANYVWWL